MPCMNDKNPTEGNCNQNGISSNNERSFSMAFNPITNIKTIREYEEEIRILKEEVFELKTQLSHGGQNTSNVPKMLYENSRKTDELEKENKILASTISSLKNQLMDLNNEKTILLNRQEQMQFVSGEKKSLLEDENKRLLHKLSKSSKTEEQLRNIIVNLESDIKMLKEQGSSSFTNEIMGYRNALEEIKGENRRLKEACNNLNINNNQLNEEINGLRNENMSLNNEIESARSQILNAHSSMCENISLRKMIDDLNNYRNSNSQQIQILEQRKLELKENLSKAVNDCKAMRSEISSLEDKNSCLKKEVEEGKKGLENYSVGMKKFKEIILEKISFLGEKVKVVDNKTCLISDKYFVNKENRLFLLKMFSSSEFADFRGNKNNLNDVFAAIKTFVQKTRREQKNLMSQKAVLENENKDMKFFGKNKLLMELQEKITEAVSELNIYRNYMEKKAKENKELKNENLKLKAEQNKISKKLKNGTVKYGNNCIKV
ncbi:hypothetical protein NUSPORA_00865 [Nucleospora cyclopteri]